MQPPLDQFDPPRSRIGIRSLYFDLMFDVHVLPDRAGPISRREYDRLVDQGYFADERLELLRGELVKMSPQKWPHAAAVSFLNEQLVLQLAGRYEVQTLSDGDVLRPTVLPEVSIHIADIPR